VRLRACYVAPTPMRRRLQISSLIALAAPFALISGPAVGPVLAQDAPAPSAAPSEPASAAPAEPAAPEEPAPSAEPATPAEPPPAPALTPPAGLAPIELPAGPTLPDPGDAATQLEEVAPPPPVEKKWWRAAESMFHLHGYFRLRGNLLKDGDLGHTGGFDRLAGPDNGTGFERTNYDPFPFFSPADSSTFWQRKIEDPDGPSTDGTVDVINVGTDPVAGGCGDNASAAPGRCDKKTQTSGDMRLRLKPEVHLSDDIRVKAWIDVMDNVGLGTMGYGPNNFDKKDVIRVRRVWGEARNRDIGELRFGRMGADWGLGILDNGGDRYGIDSDFSSDVDRVMAITNLAGFYLMAAYDWAYEGWVSPNSATPSGIAIDRAQKDDLDVFTFAAAHRLDADLQQSALLRGEKVFNYGAYFVYRDQFLQWNPGFAAAPVGQELAGSQRLFSRLNQTQYIPDLWLQFLWEGLRVELEAAFVAGSLEGQCPKFVLYNESQTAGPYRDATEVVSNTTTNSSQTPRGSNGQCKFRQLGIALETEYRLFDDRLGIYFMSGLATGDKNAYGLALTNDPALQKVDSATATGNRQITTYQFHPDYRVDLILWRTIMRRVAGGYYFKPGVSYDFIHDSYGQRAGGRLDLIYSRASAPEQTWGDSGNLGLEIDLSLYYRSADGPDPMDGFYGLVQAGMLFPFAGLGYAQSIVGAPSTANAIMFRGVAGIAF
jgi:uncharacterized protein (TIGR04551 family)